MLPFSDYDHGFLPTDAIYILADGWTSLRTKTCEIST